MLKRKIQQAFLAWKNSENHNPIIIKGCRQCGKTYSVLQFARQNYKNVVYVNFFENPAYAKAFEGNLQVDAIVMNLTVLIANAKFEPGNTCLILDEIQECPRARMALKFFKLDGRYDVMCTGSLLGISGYGTREVSVPVGYETVVEMHPLDFEEFLWGNGISEEVIGNLETTLARREPVAEAIHARMNELLLQYVVVGGMPAAVSEFVSSHMLNKVLRIQRDIVSGYRDDMIKYAPTGEKSKIRECFDTIPQQLSRENKKFSYALVQKKGSADKFAGSLQWMEDAGIIQRCYNLNITELPLAGNADKSSFKVYMADIGLFISMLEDGTQADIIHGSLLGYKGAIFENLVADFLSKADRKLYYFRKDSGLEIDFVTRISGECVLVECKATTGNAKSTRTVLRHPEKYHVDHAVKLGRYNIGYADGLLTLPLYMGFFLSRLSL
jgi:hypothetical protein